MPTDFRMSSDRERKRWAPARFDEASSIVGDRSGRGTDDLVTILRRASSTVMSRSVAKSTRSSSAPVSIVAPPSVLSAVATSDAVSSPCRPAGVSIRHHSTSASTRITSAAAPRRSTSAAPSARRAPRCVPSPVDEESAYIPHEDAVSSDGEVTPSDDMPAQMAEMRREMAVMHNLVHVMTSISAQPITGPATGTAQPITGPSTATAQPIAGPSIAAAQPIAGPSIAAAQPIAGPSIAAAQPIAGPSIAAAQPIAGPSTAAAQRIAGPSTPGAHPLASCSTAAAQPIAARVGIVGERPNNMASFSSVPLGSLVDPKVKAKIGAGQFVELDSLVGEFSESPVLIFDVNNRNPSTNE